jgi:hypothetical protein
MSDNKLDQSTESDEFTKSTDVTESTEVAKSTELNTKTEFNSIIRKYVRLLQLKMDNDEMIFLKKYHYNEYETKMSQFVPQFKDNYPSLFQMIISGSNLTMLDLFLEKFTNIDEGKQTLNEARDELGHVLHNKYVSDKVIK